MSTEPSQPTNQFEVYVNEAEQEAFLRAFHALGRFDPLRPRFFAICKSQGRNRRRLVRR